MLGFAMQPRIARLVNKNGPRSRQVSLATLLAVQLSLATVSLANPLSARRQSSSPEHGLDAIRTYISSGWDALTRSMADCKTVVDPKISTASVLYLPADLPISMAVSHL